MNYQQPDGLPLSVNLADAARISGASVASLRNYIARNVLRHVGRIPLAGAERRFSVSGLVEIGILTELVAARLPVTMASHVTESLIQYAYDIAFLSDKFSPAKKRATSHSADTGYFDDHPNEWMIGKWKHRELKRPKIAIYFPGDPPRVGKDLADGWGGIDRVRARTIRSFFGAIDGGLLPAVPRVMGTLNITEILCKIDSGIQEKFSTAT